VHRGDAEDAEVFKRAPFGGTVSVVKSLAWNRQETRFFAVLRMTRDSGRTIRKTDLKTLCVLRVFAVHING
jgi:hypothetical protein